MSDYKYILEFKDIPFSREISSSDEEQIKGNLIDKFHKWENIDIKSIRFDKIKGRFFFNHAAIGRVDQLDGYTVVILQIGSSEISPYPPFEDKDVREAIKEQQNYWRRRGVKY